MIPIRSIIFAEDTLTGLLVAQRASRGNLMYILEAVGRIRRRVSQSQGQKLKVIRRRNDANEEGLKKKQQMLNVEGGVEEIGK